MPRRAKLRILGQSAVMGGAFTRAFFSLDVRGEKLDPGKVTSLLGIAPTRSFRKGDKTPMGHSRQFGLWTIESGEQRLSAKEPGSKLFESWVASLPADRNVWQVLKKRFEVRVSLAIYSDQMNAEFVLTPDTANELAKRGLTVVFDPYFT